MDEDTLLYGPKIPRERCCWEWQARDRKIKRCRKNANEGGVYCDKHCAEADRDGARALHAWKSKR